MLQPGLEPLLWKGQKMPAIFGKSDTLGMIRPLPDVHTLGMSLITDLLRQSGHRALAASKSLNDLAGQANPDALAPELEAWIRGRGITMLALSYRLDPHDGARLFTVFNDALVKRKLLVKHGGPVKAVFFAGLPATCELVRERHPWIDGLFLGDESPAESLRILGIDPGRIPEELSGGIAYDEERLKFGKELVEKGHYQKLKADRIDYPLYGKRGDNLLLRWQYKQGRGSSTARSNSPGSNPLIRSHIGPWLPDRKEALALFSHWARELAKGGLLDVLSIGSSQLSQEAFDEEWGDRPNGGGVPYRNGQELAEIWRASRPMLVRAYSGTKNTVAVARALEEHLDIAWHALSFWWFCQLDGRGPLSVQDNLGEHFATLRYIAGSGKAFEANVPHHFAFRGADDISYILSAYLGAKAARLAGIRTFVLQIMLNTPKFTHGLQDIAKARAALKLVKSLEDSEFRVLLQTRGGLDYFSHIEEKAKAQLAAVTALMAEIEPENGPDIIHIVNWSEAIKLADPGIVNESIRISRQALLEWQARDSDGRTGLYREELEARTEKLFTESRLLLEVLEELYPDLYSPKGFYRLLKDGIFPLPWLSALEDEFAIAKNMSTRPLGGGMSLTDSEGKPIDIKTRVAIIRERRADAR